jgi:hypothetical protein
METMSDSFWFNDIPVLGKLSATEMEIKLRELGEDKAEKQTRQPAQNISESYYGPNIIAGLLGSRKWKHTAYAFGYIAPVSSIKRPLSICHAGNLRPDVTLKNKRIKISLGALRLADYPGYGTHHVLFDFYAQNQVPSATEHLHFNVAYRVREGERAAVLGYPLFLGLNVGNEGVCFKCYTVNVKNEEDESALSFLESDVFRAGLKLATFAQPVIAPFATMAYNLTKTIAKRARNTPVQDFTLGLDFNLSAMGARLAEGSYIAVQIPEAIQLAWDWDEWAYDPGSGQLVWKKDGKTLIPYNYIAFNVNKYEGE